MLGVSLTASTSPEEAHTGNQQILGPSGATTGCCLFLPTPAYNVDFPNGFKDKENVVIYDKDNPNDLIDKINYYLNNRDDLKRIAKSGFENLLKYHTSEARAKEFIETCERYINGS